MHQATADELEVTGLNMTTALPNFCQPADTVVAIEQFYAQVATVCTDGRARCNDPRSVRQLGYLAREAQRLAQTAQNHRLAHLNASANAFIQYTPERSLPGEDDLTLLTQQCTDVPAALRLILDSTESFIMIHRELQRRARTAEAADLHRGCCVLLDTWQKNLSRAYVQDADI